MKQKALLLICLVFLLTSCSTIVESKNQISNFKIEISKLGNTETLLCKFSGNTTDSALWIKSYTIEYQGNNVFVIIEKCLKPTAISNPYFIQFIVPENTENIYLGKKEVVWSRSN